MRQCFRAVDVRGVQQENRHVLPRLQLCAPMPDSDWQRSLVHPGLLPQVAQGPGHVSQESRQDEERPGQPKGSKEGSYTCDEEGSRGPALEEAKIGLKEGSEAHAQSIPSVESVDQCQVCRNEVQNLSGDARE